MSNRKWLITGLALMAVGLVGLVVGIRYTFFASELGNPSSGGGVNSSSDSCVYGDNVYLVDWQKPDNNGDGKTWATALKTVTAAVNLVKTNPQPICIWMKNGTYQENNISIDSTIVNGVALTINFYGGFAGDETAVSARQADISQNLTVIDANFLGGIFSFKGKSSYINNILIDRTTLTNGLNQDKSGGAIYSYGTNLYVKDSVVSNSSTTYGDGGGIYNNNTAGSQTTSVAFDNDTFTNNSAVGAGGAISIHNNDYSITNCQFVGNKGDFGGALGILAVATSIHGKVIGNNFSKNSATSFTNNVGGAIFIEDNTNALIEKNFLSENSAFYGSAIGVSYAVTSTFQNNIIANNKAVKSGTIVVQSYSSAPNFVNNTVANNTDTDVSSPAPENATVYFNFISSTKRVMQFYNNQITDNSASVVFRWKSNTTDFFPNTCLNNNYYQHSSTIIVATGDDKLLAECNFGKFNNQNQEPGYLNNQLTNYPSSYALNFCSGDNSNCSAMSNNSVDKGSAACNYGCIVPTVDYYGTPRDAIPDIGAMEYQKLPNGKSMATFNAIPDSWAYGPTARKLRIAITGCNKDNPSQIYYSWSPMSAEKYFNLIPPTDNNQCFAPGSLANTKLSIQLPGYTKKTATVDQNGLLIWNNLTTNVNPPSPYAGDSNYDNKVNLLDIGDVLTYFNQSWTCDETTTLCPDIDGNSKVGLADLGLVLTNYNQSGE